MPIHNRFADLHSEITGWRRHLHTIPELNFDLPKTAAFVEQRLREIGVDALETGVAQTGMVAVIKGKSDTSGRVIGLRADMDALPIHEIADVDYKSTHAGAMHACGHDGHTAMLLGAAKYLVETRNFDGTAVLFFQPAEEGGGGGKVMVDEGVMERYNVDEVYGLHNMPGGAAGSFAIRKGGLMAATDLVEIKITGKGGHGAMPHSAIDPNITAAHILLALQSITSRNVDPLQSAVLSICMMSNDSAAFNVIPQTVNLCGTVRTLSPEVRDLVEARLIKLVSSTADAFECAVEINYERGYPVTVNHDAQTDFAVDVACAIAGVGNVDPDTAPMMAGEDFSYMLEARPGAYIFLGNGENGAMVHHPEYVFNDDIIPAGCSWLAGMVEARMPAA
ncbi:M20 aminoacylase family protein [Planktotalea arctica]|uniref:M20 aminoacylase family protein n=2 Tax=Planktotalea arctica TaxID=1481893 RepID=UPI00321B0EF6